MKSEADYYRAEYVALLEREPKLSPDAQNLLQQVIQSLVVAEDKLNRPLMKAVLGQLEHGDQLDRELDSLRDRMDLELDRLRDRIESGKV